MKRIKPKLYVIRKYVYALSASDAIKRERYIKVDDCWIDDDFRKSLLDTSDETKIGFKK